MIISNNKKYLFVHIHKTAGTSIANALDKYICWNDVVLGGTPFGEKIQDPYKERFNLHKHSTANEIREVIGNEIWDSLFKFTFVRHPYSRVVSLYTFIEARAREFLKKNISVAPFFNWPEAKAYKQTNSFSEFIKYLHLHYPNTLKNQVDWISDTNGNIILDFIGKTENLDRDIKIVSERIGLGEILLNTLNRSGKGNVNEYLRDEKDYKYLNELFRKDFEILDYDPDLRFR